MHVLEEWLLTPERVAVHLPTATAVVADLHLGYHLTRRSAGDAVPLPTLEEQVGPLARASARHPFHKLLVAGDLVEKISCPDLIENFLSWLQGNEIELLGVVPGNHDRRIQGLNLPFFPQGYNLGTWQVIHGNESLPNGPMVCGHWHPSHFWKGRKRPCYLIGPQQLILPAFSPEAAGAQVTKKTRWQGYRCLVIVGQAVEDAGLLAAGGNRRK
jgi:metallophosphoesterase superfamily enzyme